MQCNYVLVCSRPCYAISRWWSAYLTPPFLANQPTCSPFVSAMVLHISAPSLLWTSRYGIAKVISVRSLHVQLPGTSSHFCEVHTAALQDEDRFHTLKIHSSAIFLRKSAKTDIIKSLTLSFLTRSTTWVMWRERWQWDRGSWFEPRSGQEEKVRKERSAQQRDRVCIPRGRGGDRDVMG